MGIKENQRKGKAAEVNVSYDWSVLKGYELTRTGKGSDYEAVHRDLFTGKVTDRRLLEVKSGNAKLSSLQEETRRRTKKYTVVRQDPAWY